LFEAGVKIKARAWKHVAAIAVALTAAAGLAFAAGKPDPSNLEVQPIAVEARALTSFDRVSLGRSRFGELTFRGGLVLTSPSPHFGGWSGMALDRSGRKLVAVSDAGAWMTAEIRYEDGRPVELKQARLGPLQALDRKTLRRGRDRDAEALAVLEGEAGQGRVLVAFEGNHRIGRFAVGPSGLSAPDGYLELPPEAARMRRSNGFEAMTVLGAGPHRGAVLAFSERLIDRDGHHSGWLMPAAGRGKPQRLALTDVDGFDLTGLAALEDGGVLLLERRFRWTEGVKMRLRRIDAAELRPGAPITGRVVLEADMAQEIDNMEAIAVHRGAGGETVITLLSDDNFNPFMQRTVLLQFVLDKLAADAGGEPRPARRK
jgi:hypothetical protein